MISEDDREDKEQTSMAIHEVMAQGRVAMWRILNVPCLVLPAANSVHVRKSNPWESVMSLKPDLIEMIFVISFALPRTCVKILRQCHPCQISEIPYT